MTCPPPCVLLAFSSYELAHRCDDDIRINLISLLRLCYVVRFAVAISQGFGSELITERIDCIGPFLITAQNINTLFP